jgi:hypothetical protein
MLPRLALRIMAGCGMVLASLTIWTAHSKSQTPDSVSKNDFPPAHWQRATGAPPGSHYVGTPVCAGCHMTVAKTQPQTSMGKASTRAAQSQILLSHPSLRYIDGPYTLRIERKDDQEIYSASDGQHTISVPIQWSFGLGDAGQTYVFERDGIYYESRASYYTEIDGLDITIGHDRKSPGTLSGALGRPLSNQEQFKCFPCHTSEGVQSGKLRPGQMQPGVTCENCHGPGSQHQEAVESSDLTHLHIFNPGHLGPPDLNDFCGTCHRTTRDVLSTNIHGIRNVRFQPYRLENSRCYDPSDKRTSCIACHNPHVNVVTDLASYDSKCLACHVASGEKLTPARKAPACPRAGRDCASCHMPKLSLPGAHFKFTDHFIRVYRPEKSYPD